MASEFNYQAAAQEVLAIEVEGLEQLKPFFNDAFAKACELILNNCSGKVVVMGIGKSGHIGRKIAATLASTGTSAFFVHPGEASHGDLGMVTAQDVVLAISNSGESEEILSLFPVLKRLNVSIISLTSQPTSTMAQLSDIHLQISVPQEACPLGLAPTTSTTVTLVMGDALAIALLRARGFTSEDFAMSHPGGALGRKLLLKLSDIMHTGDELPQVSPNTFIRDALLEISQKGLGMTAITDQHNTLLGIFTDGDLRRILDKRIDIHNTPIERVMTTSPTTASPHLLAVEGINLMQDKRISGLMLTDDGKLVGALNMHDLLKAGVM
ncbi:arabinose-5-phosphate isomerase KdsD [Vibrio zhugei]|uniref:Arabinose 5-phosphate isomerase n=1 Tax=Vibrio zhugei TaxID=2479546 RepID=A0ABV7C8T2_9VIBR|nr:arabinose-5-phosphate isomerase KdsD [Vibrio zhugei]